MNYIKEILNRNKTLVSNFSYLSILQVTILLIPLVTYPYLIRILEKDLYGLVVFTQVVAGYFSIFISFGFSMFGAKQVSIHRNDKQKLSEIVSSITLIKFVFLSLSFVLLFGYLFFSSISYKWLYVLSFWVCILDVVFPTWFFQGIEKMKFITFITLANRLLFTILIFLLIKDKQDVLWFPMSNMVGVFLSGIVSFYFIKKEGIWFIFPTFSMVKQCVKNSYHFFLSNVLVQVYANSNKAVIGSFLGMGMLAYYDLAEKIVNLARIPQSILSQTVFPRISIEKNEFFIKKVFKISVLINAILYIMLFFGAEYIVLLLAGEDMLLSVSITRIIGLLIPVVCVSNVMGVLTLIPFGFNKLFTKMIGVSAISYFILFIVILGIDFVNIYSLSVMNVLVEIIVSIISVYFVYKSNILWKKKKYHRELS